jgi:hypothetical protein
MGELMGAFESVRCERSYFLEVDTENLNISSKTRWMRWRGRR